MLFARFLSAAVGLGGCFWCALMANAGIDPVLGITVSAVGVVAFAIYLKRGAN